MTSYGYIIGDSYEISFDFDCIMQLKQYYNIATKVSGRKMCYYFWWSTWPFKVIFSQWCDIFLQKWHENMQENGQCTNYLMFKHDLQIQKYLSPLDNRLKYNLAKFRTRTYHLPVTTARFNKDHPVHVSYPLCESGKIRGNVTIYLLVNSSEIAVQNSSPNI